VTCSVCHSCDSIDYSNEAYLAVNRKWLATHRETWINANCSEDFKLCLFNITDDMGEAYSVCLMRYFSCPACLPTIPDIRYKAKCITNVYQKTTM
jgi:hypothetical protein